MALNKAHTSIWVKILIIVLIIAFVSLFMYQGLNGIFDLFKQSPQTGATTTVDDVATINAQNKPVVDALTRIAASNPASYTAAVRVANAYFDWARVLSQPQAGQSRLTTQAIQSAYQEWTAAAAAYEKAAKLDKAFDPSMQTDRSYAVFNSGETTLGVSIVSTVTVKAPKFAQAWVHLGLYYEALGNKKQAIPAYQRGLALDPKGQNANFLRERLQTLGVSLPASVTATTGVKP